jgi:hypothetical protein
MRRNKINLSDTDIVNDPRSAANAGVPAGFAGSLAADRFISNVGRNSGRSLSTVLGVFLILGVCQAVRADTMYQTTAKNLSGLVAYYTFDGVTSSSSALTDDSSSGNDGTFTAGTVGVSSNTPGTGSNQSLALSSGNAYVTGISQTGFPTSNADRSIVLWMKTTETDPFWESVFEAGSTGAMGAACHVGLSFDTKGVFAGQWGGALNGPNVSDNKWHMITVTVAAQGEGTALWSLYTDNNTTPATSVLATNTVLGNNGNGSQIGIGTSNFIGGVDELAYYNRVLGANEIQSLYAAMDVTVPEPSTITLMTCGLIGLRC